MSAGKICIYIKTNEKSDRGELEVCLEAVLQSGLKRVLGRLFHLGIGTKFTVGIVFGKVALVVCRTRSGSRSGSSF